MVYSRSISAGLWSGGAVNRTYATEIKCMPDHSPYEQYAIIAHYEKQEKIEFAPCKACIDVYQYNNMIDCK